MWSVMANYKSRQFWAMEIIQTWNANNVNNNPDEIGQYNDICNQTSTPQPIQSFEINPKTRLNAIIIESLEH